MAIAVVARLKAKEGKFDELLATMQELQKAVKENEPDTLEYALHRSKKDTNTIVVYEKYKSEEAMNAHMNAPHFKAAGPKMFALLDGAFGVESFDVIE